ncbi:Oidioi.mRNA.OKI2018_I69.XSR.g15952.t1.cds [Oikopleura dioica]|uniref:Oidioi.mRNA.OKI2018_I69.XSR.g15952.t1.cds n=1 Tax=Oikopleura dioica TaxID=34765 RepID=A0ABN7SJH6_OIKDI|nr:Oidioi.mRNA.OKI2018_I69.XSR.g15952.t1.cds [Oikopleura dioica]
MGTALFNCDNVKPLSCVDKTETNIMSSTLFDFEGMKCCEIETGCEELFNNPAINETSAMKYFRDVDNDGNPTIVSFERVWQRRVREVQGAIITASLVELFLGATGLIGVVLTFISPLAIAPVITLVGLTLYVPAIEHAEVNWPIAILSFILVTLFSQYLGKVQWRIPYIKNKKLAWTKFPVFEVFPVLLGLIISWGICGILTAAANNNPSMTKLNDPTHFWYQARTDIKAQVIGDAPWFRFVYPFQWGAPSFSAAGTVGLLSGVFAGMLESIGDYYAAADIANIPPPPVHAINRGIMMEGIACVIAGSLGSGNGTTTYSENIATLRITKCASRCMIQTAALILFILGFFGKFTAFFTTLPEPVIGGLYFVMFGLISGVGISNLKYVDLGSSRNVFVFGFSIFLGLALPFWSERHPNSINTGSTGLDQVIVVLMSTAPFVAGVAAILLDNTIPGTRQERGLASWNSSAEFKDEDFQVYDIPWLRFITNISWMRHIPISPAYQPKPSVWPRKVCPCSQKDEDVEECITNKTSL